MSIIRFAVGTKEELHSSVWCLWSNKNDLYLTARSQGGLTKFSFHESGIYRVAINSTVENKDNTIDRARHKWTRPKEIAPGWTPCFDIQVPPRITKKPFKNVFNEKKILKLVPSPDENKKIVFNIILSNLNKTSKDLIHNSSTQNVTILGQISMPREIAWLIAYEDNFTQTDAMIMKEHFEKVKIHLKAGSSYSDINEAFLHVIYKESTPFLVDLELGEENINIP
jgi:hypothetical protein